LKGKPPALYEALSAARDTPVREILKRCEEERQRLAREMADALQTGDAERAVEAQQRLGTVDEAAKNLRGPAEPAQYDREGLGPEEHAYHETRRQLVSDLGRFAGALARRRADDLVPLLVRAYRSTPHEHIDVYFEAAQPGLRRIIRENMAAIAVKDLM